MRVLTWNIHSAVGLDGRLSTRRIARVIESIEPDVVGLNEVRALRVVADEPRSLARLLGMAAAFQPNMAHPLRRFGNLVLTRGEIVGEASVPLPGAGEPRGLLLAEIELDGERFTFGCTHLGLTEEARRQQKEAVLDALPRGGRVVLAGDFNEGPDALGPLAERLRLAAPRPSYPANAPTIAIDLVLIGAGWRVEHTATVQTDASDHLPVVADLVPAEGEPDAEEAGSTER